MVKEYEPTTAQNPQYTFAFVDEKATVITVCHQCGVLYSAREKNLVTAAVAEITARSHGNSFSLSHHVSVVSGESPTLLEETLTVNEKSKLKPKIFPEELLSIPAK